MHLVGIFDFAQFVADCVETVEQGFLIAKARNDIFKHGQLLQRVRKPVRGRLTVDDRLALGKQGASELILLVAENDPRTRPTSGKAGGETSS